VADTRLKPPREDRSSPKYRFRETPGLKPVLQKVPAMSTADPLYEMLPSPDKLEKLKWISRLGTKGEYALIRPPDNPQDYSSMSRLVRAFMTESHAVEDRRCKNRLEKVMRNIYDMASTPGPHAVKAAEFLWDRGWGTPKTSADDGDGKRGNAGYQVVILPPPGELSKVPIEHEKSALPPVPDFIDAEFKEGA